MGLLTITALFLIFMICPTQCGLFDDAKEIASGVKSIADISLSADFRKAHRHIAFTMGFMKKTVPFGELFATALKIGLEEDKLEALLTLTNGINDVVVDVSKQQKYIQSSTVYRDLILEYETKASERIEAFLGQIRFMSALRMNVTQAVKDAFVRDCNSILNSPMTIAQYMAKLVNRCGEPNLPQEPFNAIFNLINKMKYEKYTLTDEEKNMFFRRFSVVYFWLVSNPSKLSFLEKFAEDRNEFFVYDKLTLFHILMGELEIGENSYEEIEADSLCLPKAAFVTHGYKRDAVERFGDMLINHVTSLEYITLFCSNITFYGHPDQADRYTLEIGQILEPVHSFISNWLDALLESTWPNMESVLIRDIIHDVAKGGMLPETNETYSKVLNNVNEKMSMVRHPSYRRQYVATRQREIGMDSMEFAFGCKPRACTNSSTMNAHCISLRTRVDTAQAYESLQSLIEFRNSSQPIFWSAMDKELYRYNYAERMVQVLAEKYHLDLNTFTNHSSYIVLREYAYPKGCSNSFSLKNDIDLENNYVQTLYYHEDGSKFTDCEDWVVILGF